MRQIIKLNDVSKSFAGIGALSEVSISVSEGEWFGLLGANGSGKTTLLKIIAGIYSPSSGSCVVRGPVTSLIGWGVGFVPQLDVVDNVFLNGVALGISRKTLKSNLDELLDFAGAHDIAHTRMQHVSSGLRSRLAFAVARYQENPILLLDEVFAVGDLSFQRKALAELKGLHSEGKTIVMVSHSMQRLRRWCSRAAWLEKGVMRAVGDVESVTESYEQLTPVLAQRSN